MGPWGGPIAAPETMKPKRRLTRRRLLTGISGAAVGPVLAGCADDGGGGSGDGSDGGAGGSPDDGSNATDNVDTNDGSEPATAELDRREANVVDVAFERGNGRYTFDVTLHHDDDGEDGYADWWQVERLDGGRLGRRELLHAHSQQPFTRSETVEISDDVACVVVRGHDETHGYGGVAVLADLDSGATRAIDQGSESRSFDESDCP